MAYLDSHNLSSNGEFRARLAAALAAYVQVVMDEDVTVPSHVERVALAVKVFNGATAYADRIALPTAVACGGVVPTDAQLDALVATYWTKIAVAPQVP